MIFRTSIKEDVLPPFKGLSKALQLAIEVDAQDLTYSYIEGQM